MKTFRLSPFILATAVAVGCSGPGSAPVAPSPSLTSPDAAADGSTLKVTAPALLSPIGGEVITDLDPDVVFGHVVPVYADEVPALQYELEIRDEQGQMAYGAMLSPSGGSSTAHELTQDLMPDSDYVWRVRARLGPYAGPWSEPGNFSTAEFFGPVPGLAGESCASAGPLEIDVVVCRRNQFGHMSERELVQFLALIAADLNAGNFAGGPWGILQKPGGNNCAGYSCDIICRGQGSSQNQYDVLIDAEGAQIPVWSDLDDIVARTCEIIR
jgi:hypothetical protein